jgi:hypothetical protein
LGYDHINQGLGYPVGRMTNDVSVLERRGGFRLFYGCGQPVTAFEDWPLQVFGKDLGPKTCVSLVRVFPKSVLAQELSQARRAAEAAPTRDNIDLYLAISMQMQDMAEAVRALSMYVTYFPEQAPIVEASALFADLAAEQPAEARTDILAAYADCQPACDWEFSKFLTPELITAEGATYLSVGIDRKTDEIQSIQLPLQLNSATAYVLELELRSFAPFDLARFAGEQIPDSYLDSWNRATDWTTFQILFVTPQWAEASRQVEFELARVFDRGGIDLRRILLVEIGAAYD